jgi:hypothetical protein
MATPAQLLANRANSQLSTGPRTPEGRQTSSANSLTTGLTSTRIYVRPEEQQTFDQFEAGLKAELKPQGPSQTHHFNLILHASWNLLRCLELENQLLEAGNVDDDETARKMDRIYRYRKMHESTHRRSTAELRKLQTEQLWRQVNEACLEESALTETAKVTLQLGKRNALNERAGLDHARQMLETFIAAPRR